MGFEVYGTTFAIDNRYTFVKALGKGAYGVVCSVKDAKTGRKLAVKKICPMAKSVYDAKHTLREIRLLRHCGQHPNIITLLDLMINEKSDELFIGMECMDTDLHRIIQSSQKLSVSHHKHFMHQLVVGIDFLHSNGILHRDLKPANLLVSKNCDLRISDFGLARRAPNATDGKPLMTEHVVTRWYRPPELMLSPDGKYTAAVDVWSIGCIFAELLGRTPLFPGKNFVHQLQLIFDVIGTPRQQETAYIKNSQAMQFLRSLPKKLPVDLSTIYPHACNESIDFMTRCLYFAASNRLTIKEAAKHAFFANAPSKDKIPQVPKLDEKKFCFDFEQQDLNEKQLRKIIIEEVRDFTIQTGLRPVTERIYTLPQRDTRVEHESKTHDLEDHRKKYHRDDDNAVSHTARTAPPELVSSSRAPKQQRTSDQIHSARYSMSRPDTSRGADMGAPGAAADSSYRHRHKSRMDEDSDDNNRQYREISTKGMHDRRYTGSDTYNTEDDDIQRVHSSRSSGSRASSRSERESHVSTSSGNGIRQKKKSRSFTSRLLGSSSLLTKSYSRSGETSSKRLMNGRKSSLRQTERSSSTLNRGNESPMSCSDDEFDDMQCEESKYSDTSAMLPIKNVLRKGSRASSSSRSFGGSAQGYSRSSSASSGWTGTTVSTSSSSTMYRSKSGRQITVPQPFNFSHPRNKEDSSGNHSARRSSSSTKSGSSTSRPKFGLEGMA